MSTTKVRKCGHCGSHHTRTHCGTSGCAWVLCTTCKHISDPRGNHMKGKG